jgi:hypothetical protein
MIVRNPLQFLRDAEGKLRLPERFSSLLVFQGLYYLITGLWPLISIESFQWVTGPKTDHLPTGHEADHWLVMTVGILVTVVGATLLLSAWRGNGSLEIAFLATGCAAGLTAIDTIYVWREVIAPIYLLDAAIQVPLIAAWATLLGWRQKSGGRRLANRPAVSKS